MDRECCLVNAGSERVVCGSNKADDMPLRLITSSACLFECAGLLTVGSYPAVGMGGQSPRDIETEIDLWVGNVWVGPGACVPGVRS